MYLNGSTHSFTGHVYVLIDTQKESIGKN